MMTTESMRLFMVYPLSDDGQLMIEIVRGADGAERISARIWRGNEPQGDPIAIPVSARMQAFTAMVRQAIAEATPSTSTSA